MKGERTRVGGIGVLVSLATFYDVNRDDGGAERQLRTQPWGDQVRLSGGTTVPLADAVELTMPGKCNERSSAGPCNDVIGSDSSCAVARSGRSSSRAPFALLACALASVLLRRRARRCC